MLPSLNKLPIPFGLKLVLLRLLSQWRALFILFIGVLLVAMIGSSIRLYSEAIAQIGLVDRIGQESPANAHFYIRTSISRAEDIEPALSNTHSAVSEAIAPLNTVVDGLVQNFVQGTETLAIPVTLEDDTALSTPMRLAYYEGLADYVQLVDGALFPESTDDTVTVAISQIASARLGLELDDHLTLTYARDGSVPIEARITAIIVENDVEDIFWLEPSPMRVDNDGESNLFVSRESFTTIARDYIPAMSIQFNWRVLFDYQQLPYGRVSRAVEQLNAVEANLDSILERPVINGNIAPVLLDFTDEMNSLGVPFTMLLVQVGLLVLLFMVVIASLIWRSELHEIDLFRTRGARLGQILRSRSLEIAILCGVAALIAPYLAFLILTWLLPSIMNTDSLALEIQPSAFLLSAGASFLAWLVLMYSVTPVLRASLQTGTGKKRQAWWYRYYLDIVILVLVVADLMRLLQSSSNAGDSITNDPVLLFTPTLLFIAVGGVLQRLFPLMMRLLSHITGRLASLSRALAVWQISREAPHYVRIIFLLSLAISIGWFATSFQTTYQRNLVDRARYATGADIRLPLSNHSVMDMNDSFAEDYLAILGVEAVTHVIRDDSISETTQSVSFGGGEALFVRHDEMNQVRAGGIVPYDLPAPDVDDVPFTVSETGRELPAFPQSFTIELEVDLDFFQRVGNEFVRREMSGFFNVPQMTFWLELRDEAGHQEFIALNLHPDEVIPDELHDAMSVLSHRILASDADELQQYIDLIDGFDDRVILQGVLPDESELSGTVSLQAIGIVNRTDITLLTDWTVKLGQFEMLDDAGNTIALDWLDDDSWAVTDPSVNFEQVAGEQHFQWVYNGGNFGFFAFRVLQNYPELDGIPVVASRAFLEHNDLIVGQVFELYVADQSRIFLIVDETEFYPTLYDMERPFIVGDMNALLYDDIIRNVQSDYPAEIWIDLAPDADVDAVMDAIRLLDSDVANHAIVFERASNHLAGDVLSLGLIGLLYLAFLMVLILSIISLLAFSWLNARQRQSEFAYMLAIGIPPYRMMIALALEQLLIMSVAITTGAITGIFLSQLVLPVLANSASRTPVTPPFIIQIEVSALIQYGLVLAAILILVMVITTWIIQQLSLSQTLRAGEE